MSILGGSCPEANIANETCEQCLFIDFDWICLLTEIKLSWKGRPHSVKNSLLICILTFCSSQFLTDLKDLCVWQHFRKKKYFYETFCELMKFPITSNINLFVVCLLFLFCSVPNSPKKQKTKKSEIDICSLSVLL